MEQITDTIPVLDIYSCFSSEELEALSYPYSKESKEATRKLKSEAGSKGYLKMRLGKPNYGESPTIGEITVESFLQANFPGEWGYNGQGQLGQIGCRIPDFWSLTGRRCIIEFFGGCHTKESTRDKLAYYTELGYECIVVKPSDVESKTGLYKVFAEPLKGNWPDRFKGFELNPQEFKPLIKEIVQGINKKYS